MRNIKTFSIKKYTLKFSIWELNAISFARSCNIPSERFFPIDLDEFFANLGQEHKDLFVAEDTSYYSYS